MSTSEQIAEITERLRAIEQAIIDLTILIQNMNSRIPDKLIVT